MNTDSNKLLLNQWQTLHNSHESYEHYALAIKLIAVIITIIGFVFSLNSFITFLLLSTLWLQEGIWKTFQHRASNAILQIENKLAAENKELNNEAVKPYLYYSQWQNNRQSSLGLVTEYIGNALKPTVIYPYLPLILLVVIF